MSKQPRQEDPSSPGKKGFREDRTQTVSGPVRYVSSGRLRAVLDGRRGARADSVLDLLRRCRNLDEERYIELYPHPMLVLLVAPEDSRDDALSTSVVDSDLPSPTLALDACLVYPVFKQKQNAFSRMITVGRAENNDVVFDLKQVSKLHAYFKLLGDQWAVCDCQSRNGTFLNRRVIEPGAPAPLASRDEVAFSPNVSTKFLLPRDVFAYLRHVQAGLASAEGGAELA